MSGHLLLNDSVYRYTHKHNKDRDTVTPSVLYLCLSAVSLRVSLKALGINADDGAHPSTAATHPKHQA